MLFIINIYYFSNFLAQYIEATAKENPSLVQQELSKCNFDNTRLYNAIVQLKKKSSITAKGNFI